MAIDPRYFIHEDDKSALDALKAIPGFTAFIKAFMKVWNENQFRILNMSSRLRIDENQLPKYYAMLGPICEKLGIEVPELYMELNVVPSAYTYGDTEPFIVLTSGLIDTIPEELIPTVLAHECGHIACHHTLYRTMGTLILGGTMSIPGIGGLISLPLQIAFAYWMRCSEFSADRAAILVDGNAENVIELCMRLSGYTKNITDTAQKAEFLKQAEEYKDLIKDNMLNQTMEFMILAGQSHPLTAVRAFEANEWAASENTGKLLNYLNETTRGLEHSEILFADSPKSLLGKNARKALEELNSEGFTNVKLSRVTEADLLTFTGTVTAVTADGVSDFPAGSWFRPDTEIVLTYYQPLSEEEEAALHEGEIRMPFSSSGCIGRNCQSVCTQLANAGFTNIFTVKSLEVRPLLAAENGVSRIEAGDRADFEKGAWFPKDIKIRVIHF